jgi:tellurite resistance protein TerC
MEQGWAWWIGFNLFVLAMLAVDLAVFHRRSHEVKLKEAALWSILWTVIVAPFNIGLWLGWLGNYAAADRGHVALNFLTGYLIERALSFDNLFVFAVIFAYFAVPAIYHHRVLFYGILGALIFRAVFIFGGVTLIEHFAWMIYVFGAFLIFTGIKLAVTKDKGIQPEKNPVVRLMRAVLPISPSYIGGRFVARVDGRLMATPLLLVLVFLEVTDVIFALDSIPAIIGITHDPFIIYTSNVFAILGLRALYFVLAAVMRMFRYLSYGLAVLLVFIGCKMVVEPLVHKKMPPATSLGIVAAILAVSIVASCLVAPKDPAQSMEQPAPPGR